MKPLVPGASLVAALALAFPSGVAFGQWRQNPSNGHWYRTTAPGNWQTAEDEAAAYGAHLVVINDVTEQDWLIMHFPLPDPYWIGLVQDLENSDCSPDCEPDGGWGWVNGTLLEFQNWAEGEPNNNHRSSEEHGAMNIFGAGLWGDYPNGPETPYSGIIESIFSPTDEALLFRQGRLGYAGCVDTVLKSDEPDTSHCTDPVVSVDRGPADHGLLRFDDLFGDGANQIPLGSQILSATLSLDVENMGGISTTLHRMLMGWDCDDTWIGWGDGIQPDDHEAAASPDATVPSTLVDFLMVDVTLSLRAWSDGAPNYGWVLLPGPENDDGWDFASCDRSNPVIRPALQVVFTRCCETNRENLVSLCRPKQNGRNLVKATVVRGCSGYPVIFRLDPDEGGCPVRERRFGTGGQARAKWINCNGPIPPGPHVVTAELSCGTILGTALDCP